MTKRAELHYDGNIYELPVISGNEDERAIDISKLRSQSGLVTLDRGFAFLIFLSIELKPLAIVPEVQP